MKGNCVRLDTVVGDMVESALVVSSAEKGTAFITELLNADSIRQISATETAGGARRLLREQEFDLVVINAPLSDESGESLSRQIASESISQAILIVKSEYYDAVSAACEGDGVLVVAKPLNKAVFLAALKMAKSARNRLMLIYKENAQLRQKIEDIRIADRAKYILITHMNMSEKEAHRYMEKQAMDMRTTKRAVAEAILRTYEN